MSMLAEPRRKQKWSVDPRNSTWSNDDSKFGQKMLERMGWTKGKGLGRSEQGSTDHIKVKVKNNSYGLGVSTSHEDNWIAHQDEFNELLAQLNNHHGQNIDNDSDNPPDESKGFSLEEKSKTSRKRVHYMKFTKGKDLSSRSETDLNCIFGKRARSAKDQEQESNSSDSQGEKEESETLAASELDTESITKTVKSTLTMQEYFAQRMAQLKKARGASSTSSSVGAESTETSRPTEELILVHNSSDESEETKRKKKKKKKKNRKPAEDVEITEEKCSTPTVVKDKENQEQECLSKKKKKKRKMAKNDNDGNEECSSTQCLEQDCEKLPPSKKKNLKKHKESELLNGHHPAENETEESEVTQKEGHREEDSVVKDEREVVRKKSKKKKRKTENQE